MAGNLVVGQSGGCTAVINSSLAGVIHEALQQPAIGGVFGARHGIRGILEDSLVDLRQETSRTLELVRNTPSAALGSCRFPLSEADYDRAFEALRARDVHYFVYIGGNDSADTAHRLAGLAAAVGYDLRVVAVPKTIDNDLPVTDHCPGYGSIARFVATATRDAGHDTEAMRHVDPVKIIEVMGRDAGWVAAGSALAKTDERDAPHLIYVPERPLVKDRFLAEVEAVYRRIGYVVVVVSETVRDEQGQHVGRLFPHFSHDRFGHPYVGNTASALSELVAAELKLRARWDKPGTIQRMSMALASPVDLDEAYQAGRAAVNALAGGHSDVMVIFVRESGPDYSCRCDLAPLEAIANRVKPLPDDFLDASGTFVSPAFRDYALPLLGDQPFASYGRLDMVALG